MSASAPRAVPVVAPEGDLARSVIRFCRLLRQWQLPLAADCAQVALQALAAIDITHRLQVQTALMITLVQRPEDLSLFGYLFNAYWNTDAARRTARDPAIDASERTPQAATKSGAAEGGADDAPGSNASALDSDTSTLSDDSISPQGLAAALEGVSSPTPHAPAARTQQAELERMARVLSSYLAQRRSRRREAAVHGWDIDLRRTLRRSLRLGGIPVVLERRRPRITKARVLIFCDVSRSMTAHVELLLDFASAVLRRAWRVEVFVFATTLARVTQQWLDTSRADLRLTLPNCGGGTQFGACLKTFLRDYPGCLTDAKTTVLILSDGLDAGDPADITQTLAQLRRASRAILWLNPLAHLDGYEPIARGMAAALPLIDRLAPAHSLHSLWRVVETLREKDLSRSANFDPEF